MRETATLVHRPKVRPPLLQRRETRSPDGIPVTRLVRFEQPVTYQKLDTSLTNLDRRDQGHAP